MENENVKLWAWGAVWRALSSNHAHDLERDLLSRASSIPQSGEHKSGPDQMSLAFPQYKSSSMQPAARPALALAWPAKKRSIVLMLC